MNDLTYMIMETDAPSTKIKSAWKFWLWGQLTLGIVLFIAYLLGGAAIFSAIEKKVLTSSRITSAKIFAHSIL